MTNQQHRQRYRALAVAAFCLAVVVPSFAGALEVDSGTDVLEPVSEVVQPAAEVLEPVTDTVDPVPGTVKDPVRDVGNVVDPVTDPVTDPVRGVVDPVTDTVKEPVRDAVDTATGSIGEPVRDVVEPVTDTGTNPRPDGPSVIGDPAVPTGSGVATAVQRRNGRTADAGRRDPREVARIPVPTGASAPAGDAAAQNSMASTAGEPGETPLATAGRVAREAVEAFRFPLLVGAAVLLFLAVQSRLDRRDPKLAAPAADEELQFA